MSRNKPKQCQGTNQNNVKEQTKTMSRNKPKQCQGTIQNNAQARTLLECLVACHMIYLDMEEFFANHSKWRLLECRAVENHATLSKACFSLVRLHEQYQVNAFASKKCTEKWKPALRILNIIFHNNPFLRKFLWNCF